MTTDEKITALNKVQRRRVECIMAARAALIGGAGAFTIGQVMGLSPGQKCFPIDLITVAEYLELGHEDHVSLQLADEDLEAVHRG